MKDEIPTPLFLTALVGTVVMGCALMLMVPVLFGAFGNPGSWAGWLAGSLALLLVGFGWSLTRFRRDAPGPTGNEP